MWGKGKSTEQFKYVAKPKERVIPTPQNSSGNVNTTSSSSDPTQPASSTTTPLTIPIPTTTTTTPPQALVSLGNKKQLQDLIIYCAFVRNHGPKGVFSEVEKDLPRIKSMGVDVLWLLPIYPIGNIKRKGPQGSPYSISDFRGINPKYGTFDDFHSLVATAHSLDIIIMLDIVFNHTSHDHNYINDHPEWYNRDHTGKPFARIERWTDIIDLNFDTETLWEELISVLEFWVGKGVGGFRCDVAKLVPLDFWLRAKNRLAALNPNLILLAESGKHMHTERYRADVAMKVETVSDAELYQAFDLTYEYDTWSPWMSLISGKIETKLYLEMLRLQRSTLPANAVKMRFVENHDVSRIMSVAPSRSQAIAWTAFSLFNSGAFLIYAGQESESKHAPTLFDYDKINWASYPLQPLLTKLALIKKSIHKQKDPALFYMDHSPAIVMCWKTSEISMVGIFNIKAIKNVNVNIFCNDGAYKDAVYETDVQVTKGQITMPDDFLILLVPTSQLKNCKNFKSDLIW